MQIFTRQDQFSQIFAADCWHDDLYLCPSVHFGPNWPGAYSSTATSCISCHNFFLPHVWIIVAHIYGAITVKILIYALLYFSYPVRAARKKLCKEAMCGGCQWKSCHHFSSSTFETHVVAIRGNWSDGEASFLLGAVHIFRNTIWGSRQPPP